MRNPAEAFHSLRWGMQWICTHVAVQQGSSLVAIRSSFGGSMMTASAGGNTDRRMSSVPAQEVTTDARTRTYGPATPGRRYIALRATHFCSMSGASGTTLVLTVRKQSSVSKGSVQKMECDLTRNSPTGDMLHRDTDYWDNCGYF